LSELFCLEAGVPIGADWDPTKLSFSCATLNTYAEPAKGLVRCCSTPYASSSRKAVRGPTSDYRRQRRSASGGPTFAGQAPKLL